MSAKDELWELFISRMKEEWVDYGEVYTKACENGDPEKVTKHNVLVADVLGMTLMSMVGTIVSPSRAGRKARAFMKKNAEVCRQLHLDAVEEVGNAEGM